MQLIAYKHSICSSFEILQLLQKKITPLYHPSTTLKMHYISLGVFFGEKDPIRERRAKENTAFIFTLK